MAIATVKFFAHSRDCSAVTVTAKDGSCLLDRDNYFPSIKNVCRGDDLCINVDNATGKIIGWVPLTEEDIANF